MRALFRRLSGAWDVLIGRAYAAEWATISLPPVGMIAELIDHESHIHLTGGPATVRHIIYDAIWDGERWLRLDSPEGEAVMRRSPADTGPKL